MKRTHLLLLLAIACSTSALPAAPRRESLVVDFAAALKGLNFDPAKLDGNAGASMAANGIPDAPEMAVAAAILHRRQQSRPDDPQAHFSFSNSTREMAMKRTRSPGANRLGGSRAGSNTFSGVRPMMLQPPGVS